jgi:hypothetical protein
MTTATMDQGAPFRRLERAWFRRLAARLEPMLWIELGAIAALASAFLFWQGRIRLASWGHDHGAGFAGARIVGFLALLVILGAAQAGARHAVRLRQADGAPAWLALPVSTRELSAHLSRMSQIQAAWLLIPALAVLAAGIRVVPWYRLLMFGAGFVIALLLATRLACELALRRVAAAVPGGRADSLVRVLSVASRRRARHSIAPARWKRMPPWQSLWFNDARLAFRVPAIRRRTVAAILAVLISILAWRVPFAPNAAHLIAFATALFASALVAEWLIAVIGGDPADVLRSLPIGLGAAWGARVGWAAAASALLLLGHALAAHSLPPNVRNFFLLWIGLSSLAITVLGVNYAISLYPRSEQAQRLLAMTLGLAMAGSLMIPLMGWIVLLTAVLHSLRRVARWRGAEVR